jgi:hypothetical protein
MVIWSRLGSKAGGTAAVIRSAWRSWDTVLAAGVLMLLLSMLSCTPNQLPNGCLHSWPRGDGNNKAGALANQPCD